MEQPKQYTPDEIVGIEKSRTISDAGFDAVIHDELAEFMSPIVGLPQKESGIRLREVV